MAEARTIDAKIVLLGSQGVGKTSLVSRYTQGVFSETVTSTIGASFFTHKITIDNTRIKCQIWDTAGQERFRSMAPMYYRGAHAAILVYDVTSQDSFADMSSWVKELQRNATGELLLCLVGNKVDIRNADSVTYDQGRELAQSIGAVFYETSAKMDTGISEAFLHIARELLRVRGLADKPQPAIRPGTTPTAHGGKCC
eukprot:m.111527 g.111527  ORF g.111527 m.111527 type:complete len:198 (+) comp19235_c4_seq1:676-1269(+)